MNLFLKILDLLFEWVMVILGIGILMGIYYIGLTNQAMTEDLRIDTARALEAIRYEIAQKCVPQ